MFYAIYFPTCRELYPYISVSQAVIIQHTLKCSFHQRNPAWNQARFYIKCFYQESHTDLYPAVGLLTGTAKVQGIFVSRHIELSHYYHATMLYYVSMSCLFVFNQFTSASCCRRVLMVVVVVELRMIVPLVGMELLASGFPRFLRR